MVVHPERKAQRALQRLVGATLCPVVVVANADALTTIVDSNTVVIVDLAIAQACPELVQRPAKAWIAVPGEGLGPADPEVITSLLTAGWTHVIAHGMPILAEELLATVQKLVRDDAFGLEKYMAWGAEVRRYQLADARDREAAVDALAKDVVAVGLPDRVGSMVSVIADELIANALYAAPVDADGTHFRRGEPRDQGRPLTGRDQISVRWATDARYLAIEVRDRWGSLDPATVGRRLVAGATPPSGGAEGGMGLPLAYACCNQFVVATAPGRDTEVVALLDVRFKPTDLGRAASFHAFVTTAAVPQEAGDP